MKKFITTLLFLLCINLALPSFAENSNFINVYNSGIKSFEAKNMKDIPYKQSLLNALGLKTNDTSLLNSIVGAHEFMDIAKKLDKRINIMPNSNYSNGCNCENIFNHRLRANFHMHTQYFDGNITIPELLEQAREYADASALKHKNKPFYIAITDHDTVEGCKEALSIIASNPTKYKNLKVIMGCEFSLERGHTLGLCLNPFDKIFESKLIPSDPSDDLKIFHFSEKEFYDYANKNSVVGAIAHPAFYFHIDSKEKKALNEEIIKSFSEFKKNLKFSCFEGYYQAYNHKLISNNNQYIKELLKSGKKAKLQAIGGNDSHSNNIFGLWYRHDKLKNILN